MLTKLRTALLAVATLLLGTVAQGQQDPTLAALVREFHKTTVFWRQFDVAQQIAETGDVRVLNELEPWLTHEDRHLRGNAAFVFAKLGDPRGFETIRAMLTDRSYRPLGQGIPGGSFNTAAPGWWLESQIGADRYYAVHLLGELKDSRAVPVLIPLLNDEGINYHVAWALGHIGDRRATQPLIAALGNRDALMRVSAIQSLEKLNATEAVTQLRALLNDQAMPRAGPRLTVADAARAAIAKLELSPNHAMEPSAQRRSWAPRLIASR